MLEKANLLLLEAESLPQGDELKAGLLNDVVQVYDQADLDLWINNAATWAEQQLSTTVDRAAVKKRVHDDLKAVLERAISDFGEQIDSTELDLLETLDAIENIPEISGLAHAIEEAFDRQMKQIVLFFRGTGDLVEVLRKKAEPIPEGKIRELAKMTHRTAAIFREMEQRPFLRSRLNPDDLKTVTERQLYLAWLLGVDHGRWREAAQFVQGIREDAVVADEQATQQMMRAMVHLAPIMVLNDAPQARNKAICALMKSYPLAEEFLTKHLVTTASPRINPSVRETATSAQAPAPSRTAESDHWEHPEPTAPKPALPRQQKQFDKYLVRVLFAVGLGAFMWIVILGSGGKPTGASTQASSGSVQVPSTQVAPNWAAGAAANTTPPQVPAVILYGTNGRSYLVSIADYDRLKPIYDELGQRSAALNSRGVALDGRRQQIESGRSLLVGGSQFAFDQFNADVDRFNSDKDQLNFEIGQLSRDVDSYNAELNRVGH